MKEESKTQEQADAADAAKPEPFPDLSPEASAKRQAAAGPFHFDIEEELKKLPGRPGVYIMHDARDEIIYVGKAISLKNRVRQYFQTSRNKGVKIEQMVQRIRRFEYIVTDSELEALVLECNLIKEHRPKYNTMLKDDKSYPFIKVTVGEDFPRVVFARTMKKDKARYFGPYTSAGAVKDTIDLIKKLYRLRSCNKNLTEAAPQPEGAEEAEPRPEMSAEEKRRREASAGEVPRPETSAEEKRRLEAPVGEAPQQESSVEEKRRLEASVKEVPQQESSVGEVPRPETSAEEKRRLEAPVGEAPQTEVSAGEKSRQNSAAVQPGVPRQATDRACLYYHLGQCKAPCQGYVSRQEYRKSVDAALDFLNGNYAPVLNGLQKKMEDASEAMEFEKAIEYRDLIASVRQVAQRQKITQGDGDDRDVLALAVDMGTCGEVLPDGMTGQSVAAPSGDTVPDVGSVQPELMSAACDVQTGMNSAAGGIQAKTVVAAGSARTEVTSASGTAQSEMNSAAGGIQTENVSAAGGDAVVQVFFIRGGRMIGRDHFFLRVAPEDTREAILGSFIKQYYAGTPFVPRELMLETDVEDHALIERWLSEKRGQRVYLRVPKKGTKEKLVEMAAENAAIVLRQDRERIKREEGRTIGAVHEIEQLLGLNRAMRMEAYDISNISGFESVGSMIVYERGKPKRSDYRKFKIRTVQGPNDYASMEEVLTRRFSHGLRERQELAEKGMGPEMGSFSRFPDLILMDGGRGQVNVALRVLESLKISIPVCGMVKDDFHRTRGVYYNNVEMPIDTRSEAFHLVTRIQDEAHRFAIEYHRSLRSKGQVRSILDEIDGIGPTRRKALMRTFKTPEAVRDATLEQLANAPSMNARSAKQVYDFFHGAGSREAQVEEEDGLIREQISQAHKAIVVK